MIPILLARIIPFQSTFPQGERRDLLNGGINAGVFQSTFPQGERLYGLIVTLRKFCFNPRSRKGNDAVPDPPPASIFAFQSTFPQGERPFCGETASAWLDSFNPRSRKGNDSSDLDRFLWFRCFNPRSRKGNDETFSASRLPRCRVSIHVPARGTTAFYSGARKSIVFQSTFPQGERQGSD